MQKLPPLCTNCLRRDRQYSYSCTVLRPEAENFQESYTKAAVHEMGKTAHPRIDTKANFLFKSIF